MNKISEELRLAMRQWATGVTIVTVESEGVRHGMTVSSFTSVSIEPPIILVTIQRIARTHDMILRSGCFGVTILSQEQQELSDRFAGRVDDLQDRFAGLPVFKLESGAPFIQDGLQYLDCRLITTFESGTNTLFIGEVVAIQAGDDHQPLLYYNQQYRRLQD